MASVDQRIVEMTFKGESFVAEIKGTVQALLSLKNGLNGLKGSEKDINHLDEAGKRFSLQHISSGVDAISGKFKALSIVGITALATLTSAAVTAGLHMLKALTIDPIKAGLEVYETKINAIQTILANTARAGTTLKQVTTALNQLNEYANLTVYNFGQMAKNIGTFTAAGVGLKTSVASIKGIANLAALSGSSAEQASTAMYQLSQAIAAGRVKLQDWNSVVNAGLGGKVFQKALIDTARVHGVAIDAMIKKDQGFRNTLQEGWLTSKILTETLKTFTGDLSVQQIKALGYTNKEAQAIFKQGQVAVRSATQIRTVTQLTQALKEEVATAWAGVWEAIIGNSVTATKTLSGFHNIAENALKAPVIGLTNILNSFNKLGGRAVVIDAVTTAFHSLGQVLHTIGAAFREVFPPNAIGPGFGLLRIATAIQTLVDKLKPSKQALNDLKTIFVGLFSVVKIGIDIFSAFFGGLTKIGSAASGAGGGFLGFLAMIASFVTKVRKAIESGQILTRFFNALGSIIAVPVKILSTLIGSLGGFGGAIQKVVSFISPFIQKIANAFSTLGDAVIGGIKSGNLSRIGTIINQILVGSVLVTIKKFISDFGKKAGGGGLFSAIKEPLEELTNTLKVMQASLKATILQRIAIAIAILAASLLVLSLINIKDLTKSLAAITVMLTQLLGAMAIATTVGGSAGIVKMGAIAVALNLLATSIVILAGAVAILAQFSWEQLAKGLSAIAVLLAELTVSTSFMSKNAPGVIASAYAMEVMAVAMNVLSFAVGRLGKLSFGELAKGIGSVAVLLALLAGFNAFGGEALIGTAAALVLVGVALNVISKAVESLGNLSVGTLAKGLIGIAAALLIISVATNSMTTGIVGAGALVIVAAALVILSDAIKNMGAMSWIAIAKAMVVLAASLLIIAGAMLLMVEALPGAAALLVVAAALAILTPVLIALGGMSWESIAKGLVTLVGVFLILAAAGILLTPLIPTLLGLGVAIALFGVGVLAAGAGVLLFAAGLTALALAVTASGAAILAFVTSILALIPATFKAIGNGIVAFASAIGRGAVAITQAFVAIFTAILNAIIKLVPLATKAFGAVMTAVLGAIKKYAGPIATTFGNLIVTMLNKANEFVPRFVSAGSRLIINLLNGIAAKNGAIVNAATNLIISFVNAIGNGAQRIVRAGVNMVINLINGVANQIRSSSPRIHDAASNLGSAIIQGMISGILGGIGGIISAAVGAAKSALSAAKSALGIHSPSKEFEKIGALAIEGMVVGITGNINHVNNSVEAMGNSMLDTLGSTLANAGNILSDNIDLQPKITPVLDLTEAKKGFGALSDISKAHLIASSSTAAATSISATNAAAAQSAGLVVTEQPSVIFNQTNTSPKALSAAEIYRQTKNQLSSTKGALASANVR